MYGSMGVKKKLGKVLKGVRLENLALVSDKGRVPVPVASGKIEYSIDEVSYLAEAAMKYNAKFDGGLEKGMTTEKLTRMLLSEPYSHHNSGIGKYAASIFAVSVASLGLLFFTNDAFTGAVIGSGSVGVTLKLVAGLVAVAFAFFLFKTIKNKK